MIMKKKQTELKATVFSSGLPHVLFNGKNLDMVKEFVGDACEIRPVYDNNGVVWGHYVVVKTTDSLVRLKPFDIVFKDAEGIHVLNH